MADPRNEERTDERTDEHPDDVLEYFGADGEEEGQRFYETGEASDIDDQTIAPPG